MRKKEERQFLELPRSYNAYRRKRLRQRNWMRWRRRFFKHLPPVTLAFLLICFCFGVGFIYFSEKVDRLLQPDQMPDADGIIVLTGGRARLETGLKLLMEGKGKRLLISGVNPAANRMTLARANNVDPHIFECCVDLGRDALNTIGNASESAQWVMSHHYKRVYIVTNNYHMPRSLILLQEAMPGIELIAYPINQSNDNEENWLQFFDRLRVLGLEYIKFIGVRIYSFL